MFHEVVSDVSADDDGSAIDAVALLSAFEAVLAEAVTEAGVDAVVETTTLDRERVASVAAGDAATLTVEEGSAVLATAREVDPDAIMFELRDHLLMGMTIAVLDVDTIAGAIDADLTGQEVQQALEGRAAMTLAQLAEVMAVIEGRKR